MRENGDSAWLVLVPNPPQHPKGDFVLREFRVHDEPAGATESKLTFSGIGLYRPALFAGVERDSKARLAPLLRAAMAQNQVGGEAFTGRWEDIGTPERLAALDVELRSRQSRNIGIK
jgi:MurNAc alpha-1-phosphate uridylyltransferase